MASPLAARRCRACEGEVQPLGGAEVKKMLAQLDGDWTLDSDGKGIRADFGFRNYYQTLAFVNAVAWIAHSENHHPDIRFGYRDCELRYTTHAIGGLSENDFICAAKVDALSD